MNTDHRKSLRKSLMSLRLPSRKTILFGGPENVPLDQNNKDRSSRNKLVFVDAELEKLEKEIAAKKERREAEDLAKIDYNLFPTILGWYFDGVFTTNFTLNEEYAEYFNEIEEEIVAKQDLEIEETFTEKVARNFWPPKWLGPVFRTRGVYLDLKEVRQDPPRTPPEMNFEKKNAVIGIGLGDENTSQIHLGDLEFSSVSGRRAYDKRDLYYWTDDTREFLLKELDDEYEWWDEDKVWRKKLPEERTPYAWYWDAHMGKFFILDKSRRDDYVFDQVANVFRKKYVQGPSINGKGPNDYYYCEITKRWLLLSDAAPGDIENDANGKRQIIKGPRGTSGLGPDDFYYSGETGLMERKDVNTPIDYYYDTVDQLFRKVGEPYGPGKSGLYPSDYTFSSKDGEWLPKNPREFFKPSPYDWYYDAAQGRFHLRDKTQRDDYEFDHLTNVWKMKHVKGPSANGLSFTDYIYDEQVQAWKLEDLYEPSEVTVHVPGKRKIKIGLRGTSGKTDDDYFYDSLLGEFLEKDLTQLDKYFYSPNEGIFRKKNKPYGPGKSKLFPYHYYFDDFEGEWLVTALGKITQAKKRQEPTPQLLSPQFQTAYDFAFDLHEGLFVKRDPDRPTSYEYDKQKGVYIKKGTIGPSLNQKTVKDYYFDEVLFSWLPLESPKGFEAKDYKNGRRNNRIGTRGKSGHIPDDFYFSLGKFHEKDSSQPELYTYDTKTGTWKLTNPPPEDAKSGQPTPSYFYFSYEEGLFMEKQDLKFGEIVLDKNSQIWVQKYRMPSDYIWDGRAYVLKPAKPQPQQPIIRPEGLTEKAKTKFVKEKELQPTPKKLVEQIQLTAEEMEYEKAWLKNYPHLAATKSRFEQEMSKIKPQKGAKSKENQVTPDTKNAAMQPDQVQITAAAEKGEVAGGILDRNTEATIGGKQSRRSLKRSKKTST